MKKTALGLSLIGLSCITSIYGFSNVGITGPDAAPVAPHSLPWLMVMLEQDPAGNMQAACGGTLIDSLHIVTAAHCVCCTGATPQGLPIPESPASLTWVQSTTNAQGQVTWKNQPRLNISTITVNPLYATVGPNPSDTGNGQNNNDVAVLTLTTPIKLSSYPTLDQGDYGMPTQTAYVAGFGARNGNDVYPYISSAAAYYVPNNIIDNAQCSTYLPSTSNPTLTNEMLCGFDQPNSNGTTGGSNCIGDSGGPLFHTNTAPNQWANSSDFILVGLVSWGGSSCGVGFPDVYTKVSAERTWIQSVVNSNS